jgi:hypothetical protein
MRPGLPSWNDGPAKLAILAFLRTVTTPGEGFVPPAERVATFDNDGTLWCEKPLYVQADFVFRRLTEMVRDDPGLVHGHLRARAGDAQWGERSLRRHHHRGIRGEGGEEAPGVATGILSLYHGDEKVGEGRIKVQPGQFSIVGEGLCVGRDSGAPVTDDYPGTSPYRFTGGTIRQVRVNVSGEPYLNLEREAVAMLMRE